MPAGGDWAVAFIVLLIFILLLAIVLIVCRLCHVTSLASLLNGGAAEEKAVLTKSENFMTTHYLKTNGDVVLQKTNGDANKGHEVKDGAAVRHQYFNLAMPEIQYTMPPDDMPEPSVEITAESPVSDTMSVASDTEGPRGLHRATSFESVSSDISVEFDVASTESSIGQLEFGLDYDSEASQLIVSVIQARDLEKDELSLTIDSFVKLWLTPETSDGRQQTKIQRGTTCPVYKERFLFNLYADQFELHNLQFQVFSSDRYARVRLIGEAELRLGDVDLKQPIRIWLNLRNIDEKPAEFGSILFSLSYLPTAERITVVIVKARELIWPSGISFSGDCCVKVYLVQNGKKIARKKTLAKKEDRNAIFNDAMIFSVPAQSLQHVQLRVKVIDSCDGKEQLIGQVTVGSSASGTELSHWNQMMVSPRKPVSMWHTLYKTNVQ